MAKKEEKAITLTLPELSWKYATFILGVLLLVSIFLNFRGGLQLTGSVVESQTLTENQASEKAIDYINNNLVQTGEVTFVSMEEANGLYKLTVSYQDRPIPVYVTKDGSYIFTSPPVDTSEQIPNEEPPTQEIPKSDKPKANAFIMSYCPYGLQFIKAYIPVMELLGDKADLELNFVHYAMHDKKEIDENTRMYCIQKEQGDKLTDYLRCFVETDDYEKCIVESGVDKAKLESCIIATDEQFSITELYNDKSTWSGGRFPLYPVDQDLATEYNVGGSPTFVVNGQTVSVNRSPEAIKELVCSAFNNPPEECEQTLSTDAESPGIGPMGEGGGSGSTAQC